MIIKKLLLIHNSNINKIFKWTPIPLKTLFETGRSIKMIPKK